MKTDIALCLWVSSHNMFDVAGNVTILTAIIEHGEGSVKQDMLTQNLL